jgi:cadmium resistance protein CadD (predicted permease)
MLFITAALSLLFTVIHLFFTHSYELLLIDLCVFISLAYALYILREKNDHQRAAYIGNAVLFTAILAITLLQHGENYTLIWTFFFAPFSIVTLGASRGLIVSFTVMVMVLAVTYTGVGEWQEGAWNLQSYLRYLIAHFLMLYVIFVIQNSNERVSV